MTTSPYRPQRVIVAVSGTIQDGFELRRNIDYRPSSSSDNGSSEGGVVEAVFLGWAVVRGVKMYFDVKVDEATSREYDINVPHRVNPAMVLTGDANDANRYALYAVDERACLDALLGEPRLLTMTPDSVRIDLDDALTSPEVSALARAMMGLGIEGNIDGSVYRTDQCAVLAVVACYKPKTFIPAPPFLVREDGIRITSFQESLALFAGLDVEGTTTGGDIPGSTVWNDAVASALEDARIMIATGGAGQEGSDGKMSADDSLYGTSKSCFRLSKRITAVAFNEIAQSAGLTLRI
ncbi:hypothetical protein ACHAXR_007389 [Thalassiosira sp. AJA248-18]